MNHNIEKIRGLMIEKLDRSIDPENDRLLLQLIAEREDVRTLWIELQQFFSTGNGRAAIDRLDMANEWGLLQNKMVKPVRRLTPVRMILALGAAAAIAGILLLTVFNRPSNNIPLKAIAATVPASSRQITLTLDNGEIINLSDNKSTSVSAGDVRLNNTGKALAYLGGSSSQWSTVKVPAGMDYRITLSDSSVLWLNSATTARFPLTFGNRTREIDINGEAYLQVAPNAGKPFIVHLPHADVDVLGTAFNLNTYDSGMAKVSLVEGKVSIRSGVRSVQLKPGFQAVAASGSGIETNAFNSRETLSWMKGQFLFSNTPVADIGKILRRWYGVEVVLDNKEVGNKRFTGIIDKHKKLTIFLDNLSSTSEVSYSYVGSELHLH